MRTLRLLLAVVLAGCAGSGERPPDAEDPASPKAAEAAWSPPADRLAGPVQPLEEVSAPEGTVWTCPMHPDVELDKPGKCPKCGMDLVPAEEEHKEHDHK